MESKKTKNNKLIDTKNRLGVSEVEVASGLKWVKGVKTYTLPTTKSVSPGDVTYSRVTVVSNTISCI